MSSEHRGHRFGGLIGRGSNPLLRRVDKIESTVLVCLVVTLLLAAPLLAVWAVRLVGAAGIREQQSEQGWKQVPAVLKQSAATGSVGLDGDWDAAWVTARWIAPDGATRTGLVAVPLNALSGQRVQVWVTRAGALAHQPLTSFDLTERRMATAVAVPVATIVLLLVTARLVRAVANRRRMVGWARAWEATGPRWTSLR